MSKKMLVWKDTSSYSRDDKDRTPNSFDMYIHNLRISVHRHIHHPPDVWLVSITPGSLSHELKSKDIEAAKAEALNFCLGWLNPIVAGVVDALNAQMDVIESKKEKN